MDLTASVQNRPEILEYGTYAIDLDEEDIKRERRKARELRSSQWWKRRRAKGVCYYCRRPKSPKELTMDHIVPHFPRRSKHKRKRCCRVQGMQHRQKAVASHGMGTVFKRCSFELFINNFQKLSGLENLILAIYIFLLVITSFK